MSETIDRFQIGMESASGRQRMALRGTLAQRVGIRHKGGRKPVEGGYLRMKQGPGYGVAKCSQDRYYYVSHKV